MIIRNMWSQFVTSSEHGGRRYLPFSFKDLSKKWFAFSKLDMSALALLQQAGVTS